MAEETNTTITEIEGVILKASTHNQMMNVTHILGISEDLRNLVQSNMENWVYQIQRCLADELDDYKDKSNKYVDKNIKEIQELYRDKNLKRKQRIIQDEEVVLFRRLVASVLLHFLIPLPLLYKTLYIVPSTSLLVFL